ncbi:Adenylate cyclase [Minicystis rosea]|nr:Adenylate cyclase [Minicystis rosea]
MRLAAPGSVAWSLAALTVTTRNGVTTASTVDDLASVMRDFHAIEPTADAASTLAFCFHGMIPILDWRGAVDLAERSLGRMHELFDAVALHEPAVLGWIDLAHAYREGPLLDDPWKGLKRAEAALAIFKAVGHRRGILLGQAFVAVHLGLLGAAVEIDPAHRTAMVDLGPMMSLHAFFSARFLAEEGALDEARRVALRTIEAGRAMGYDLHVWRGRWALAEVLRRSGDLAGAAREAEAAIEAFAALPFNRTAARATLAAIRLAEGRTTEALAESSRAMDELEAMGGIGLSSTSVRLVHAECLAADGDRARASAAVAGARDRLLVIASTIDHAGYRRSFLENVPENARTMALAHAWLGPIDATAAQAPALKASG